MDHPLLRLNEMMSAIPAETKNARAALHKNSSALADITATSKDTTKLAGAVGATIMHSFTIGMSVLVKEIEQMNASSDFSGEQKQQANAAAAITISKIVRCAANAAALVNVMLDLEGDNKDVPNFMVPMEDFVAALHVSDKPAATGKQLPASLRIN